MSPRVQIAPALGALAFTCAAAMTAMASGARAADHATLGDALFGDRTDARPTIAHYHVDAGESFVLDVSPGRPALLKFEGSPEIWALRPAPGPRGDTLYKNDVGQVVVRATRLGGLTVFTPDRPEGMPAAFNGLAAAPRMVFDIGPQILFNIFVQASLRASKIAQHTIDFDGPTDVTPATAPIFADAAILASQAFVHVGLKMKDGRALVARFARVEFAAGHNADAAASGQVVQITVAPDRGVAGRPSSERIAKVLARR